MSLGDGNGYKSFGGYYRKSNQGGLHLKWQEIKSRQYKSEEMDIFGYPWSFINNRNFSCMETDQRKQVGYYGYRELIRSKSKERLHKIVQVVISAEMIRNWQYLEENI